MAGLIYKHFVGSKKESLLMLVVAGIMVIFSLVAGAPALMPCIGGLMGACIVAPAASIQLDKQSGWNKFICASPISRRKTVLALYLSTLISNCFFICLLLLLNLCQGVFPLWLFPTLFALALLLQSVALPVGLRFGQTAVVIIVMVFIFGAAGVVSLLAKWGLINDGTVDWMAHTFLQTPWLSAGLALLVAVLIFSLSFLVACRVYRRMEF